MARVYISKVENQDVSAAVNFCLDSFLSHGSLDEVKKALIKPNLSSSSPAHTGVTTDLRIVSSLARLLMEKGVEKVFIGESALINTQQVFESLDVFQLERLRASVVNFDKGEWVEVVSPSPLVLEKFRLAQIAYDCDLFISVAKMKTHCDTKVTLSIKNILGSISPYCRKVGHKTDISKAIVEVFAYLKTNKKFLSVIDATHALEGKQGPTWGKPVRMDLIVSSEDAVAADATCVELMDYDVNKVEHILLADKLGLGSIGNREILGEKIEEVKRKFDMPLEKTLFPNLLPPLQERLFKRLPYLEFKDRCTGCRRCINACPGGNISLANHQIKIGYQNCLSCLICCEACMEGALNYKISHSSAYRVAKGVRDLYWKLRYGGER